MLQIPRRDLWPVLGGTILGLLPRAGRAGEKRPIRIGQIGVGHAHASKLSVYQRSPDYDVVGIVEPDESLRKSAQDQETYRGLAWMTQDELLGAANVQAVLVETRVPDLLNAAEACIAAGKHVHIDKPAGLDLAQFQRILAIAERQALLVQMGYMYRYSPAVVLLRDLLNRGWLGEIFEVHAVMSKVVTPGSREPLSKFPGGMMFELGCHLIDLVVGLLGKPHKVESFLQHVSPVEDGLLDNTLAVFEYPKATATIRSSGVEVAGGDRRHLAVCGTEGTFHIQPLDEPRVRLALSQARGPYKAGYQDIDVGPYERYVADAADMARVIRGEKPSDFPYAHDLAVQQSLLAACRAGR